MRQFVVFFTFETPGFYALETFASIPYLTNNVSEELLESGTNDETFCHVLD